MGAVNADEEGSLASKYNIKGFPTIKLFYGSKVEEYQGQRTAQGFVDAALRAVRNKVEATLLGKGGSGKQKLLLISYELTRTSAKLIIESCNKDTPGQQLLSWTIFALQVLTLLRCPFLKTKFYFYIELNQVSSVCVDAG